MYDIFFDIMLGLSQNIMLEMLEIFVSKTYFSY